jgi:hypothetical protein
MRGKAHVGELSSAKKHEADKNRREEEKSESLMDGCRIHSEKLCCPSLVKSRRIQGLPV